MVIAPKIQLMHVEYVDSLLLSVVCIPGYSPHLLLGGPFAAVAHFF